MHVDHIATTNGGNLSISPIFVGSKRIMLHRVSLKAPLFAGATQRTSRLVLVLQPQVHTATCSGTADWDVTQDE